MIGYGCKVVAHNFKDFYQVNILVKVSCKSGISKVYVLVKIWFSSNKTLMVLTERQKPQQRNGKQTITKNQAGQ